MQQHQTKRQCCGKPIPQGEGELFMLELMTAAELIDAVITKRALESMIKTPFNKDDHSPYKVPYALLSSPAWRWAYK